MTAAQGTVSPVDLNRGPPQARLPPHQARWTGRAPWGHGTPQNQEPRAGAPSTVLLAVLAPRTPGLRPGVSSRVAEQEGLPGCALVG